MGTPLDLKLFDLINARAVPAGVLHIEDDSISAAELIRSRVEAEVARHNAGLEPDNGQLVTLDGSLHRGRVDAERQVQQALAAFESNGFFVLVGDRQLESLDERIAVTDDTEVKFMKLVPLVGG